MQVEEWRQLYQDSCAEHEVTPIDSVMMRGSSPQIGETPESKDTEVRPDLIDSDHTWCLNGNSPELFERKLNCRDISALCTFFQRAVHTFPTLGLIHDLDLSYNQIGNEGVMAIASLIPDVFMNLQVLNLAYNDFNLAGMEKLTQTLVLSSTIQSLSLTGNDFSRAHDSHQENVFSNLLQLSTSLELLDLGSTGLDMYTILSLAHQMTLRCQLVELYLDRSYLAIGEESNFVFQKLGIALEHRQCTTLQLLSLSQMGMRDEDIEALLPGLLLNPQLTHLILRGNRISPFGAASLSQLLQQHAHLVYLDVEGNRLGDDGAILMTRGARAHPSLRGLCLASNNLGERGLVALCDLISTTTELVKVTSWGNRWDLPGAAERLAAIPESQREHVDLDVSIQMVDGKPVVYRL